MADLLLFFDELLREPNLRAKTYILVASCDESTMCVELRGRRAEDYFFARRWVPTRSGRRLLYWVLDEAETQGFRFMVATSPAMEGDPGPRTEPWARASRNWAQMSEEERRIHTELFPNEPGLLRRGYDWDDGGVYLHGSPLARDAHERILEHDDGVAYEWVKVPDEVTWRRFPLHPIARHAPPPTRPSSPIDAGAPT